METRFEDVHLLSGVLGKRDRADVKSPGFAGEVDGMHDEAVA